MDRSSNVLQKHTNDGRVDRCWIITIRLSFRNCVSSCLEGRRTRVARHNVLAIQRKQFEIPVPTRIHDEEDRYTTSRGSESLAKSKHGNLFHMGSLKGDDVGDDVEVAFIEGRGRIHHSDVHAFQRGIKTRTYKKKDQRVSRFSNLWTSSFQATGEVRYGTKKRRNEKKNENHIFMERDETMSRGSDSSSHSFSFPQKKKKTLDPRCSPSLPIERTQTNQKKNACHRVGKRCLGWMDGSRSKCCDT